MPAGATTTTSPPTASGSASSPRPGSPPSTWPAEYGGQGLGPLDQVVVNQEIGARRRARDLRRHRRRDARPDPHRPRHRGAEAAPPRPDAPRRRGLVPALLRARGRLRPRRRSSAARGSRTTARWRALGPEGVDDERPVRHLRPAARPHRRRRAQAQGPDHVHRPDGRRGRDRRPLRQITGDAEFNEVFFDDVALEPGSEVGPGRRRLGRGPDDADVRAPDHRARRRELRLSRRPLRRERCSRDRRPRARPRGPPPPRRAGDRAARAALHRLPRADRRSRAASIPGARGRAGQGDDAQARRSRRAT